MKKETDQDCCQNKVPTEHVEGQKKGREKDQDYLYKRAETIQERACPHGSNQQGEYTLEDYYALPDDQRVELIDGVFYDMSAPTVTHQYMAFHICRQLDAYIRSRGQSCISLPAPVDVQLDRDDRTMVQPDVLVVCDRDRMMEKCVYGAPDLIVEVLSPSTGWKDSVLKLKKYREAGVREYWIVDLEKKRVTVYEFACSAVPVMYGMNQEVPVGIFEGKCRIDVFGIYEDIRAFYS